MTALMLTGCGGAGAPPQPAPRPPSLPIVEAQWIAADADLLAELTTEPAECLAAPPAADSDMRLSIEIGRAAFRAPTLLGGQAARAGLSCASCHRNGRDNPAFSFFGVSGAPGTADVTSSFFSSHRGDGVANPVPIPDLAGPREQLKVDRTPESGALEAFVHGLVTEEFDGPEPPPRVLAGLAAYVRALDPNACPGPERASIRAADRSEDARRAVAAGRDALDRSDAPTAELMLAGARAELGRLHDRYAGAELVPIRDGLRASDRGLAAAQGAIRAGADDVPERLAAWSVGFADLERRLREAEPASLFDADVLSRALARQDQPG